jgi:hypothetical protein
MMAHFLSRFQYLGNNDVLFDVTLQFHTKTLRVLLQWYIRGIGRLLRLDNHVSLWCRPLGSVFDSQRLDSSI